MSGQPYRSTVRDNQALASKLGMQYTDDMSHWQYRSGSVISGPGQIQRVGKIGNEQGQVIGYGVVRPEPTASQINMATAEKYGGTASYSQLKTIVAMSPALAQKAQAQGVPVGIDKSTGMGYTQVQKTYETPPKKEQPTWMIPKGQTEPVGVSNQMLPLDKSIPVNPTPTSSPFTQMPFRQVSMFEQGVVTQSQKMPYGVRLSEDIRKLQSQPATISNQLKVQGLGLTAFSLGFGKALIGVVNPATYANIPLVIEKEIKEPGSLSAALTIYAQQQPAEFAGQIAGLGVAPELLPRIGSNIARVGEMTLRPKSYLGPNQVEIIPSTTIPKNPELFMREYSGKTIYAAAHETAKPPDYVTLPSGEKGFFLKQFPEAASGYRKAIGSVNYYSAPSALQGSKIRVYGGYAGIGEAGSQSKLVFSFLPERMAYYEKGVLVQEVNPIQVKMARSGLSGASKVAAEQSVSGESFQIPVENLVLKSREQQLITPAGEYKPGSPVSFKSITGKPQFTYIENPATQGDWLSSIGLKDYMRQGLVETKTLRMPAPSISEVQRMGVTSPIDSQAVVVVSPSSDILSAGSFGSVVSAGSLAYIGSAGKSSLGKISSSNLMSSGSSLGSSKAFYTLQLSPYVPSSSLGLSGMTYISRSSGLGSGSVSITSTGGSLGGGSGGSITQPIIPSVPSIPKLSNYLLPMGKTGLGVKKYKKQKLGYKPSIIGKFLNIKVNKIPMRIGTGMEIRPVVI